MPGMAGLWEAEAAKRKGTHLVALSLSHHLFFPLGRKKAVEIWLEAGKKAHRREAQASLSLGKRHGLSGRQGGLSSQAENFCLLGSFYIWVWALCG